MLRILRTTNNKHSINPEISLRDKIYMNNFVEINLKFSKGFRLEFKQTPTSGETNEESFGLELKFATPTIFQFSFLFVFITFNTFNKTFQCLNIYNLNFVCWI